MTKEILLTLAALLLIAVPAGAADYGKTISTQSWEMVKSSPEDTFILDVRTRAEYAFTGHPDTPNGTPNIPLKFWPGWVDNPNFVSEVSERFDKDDTIITMCRSGGRAEAAARVLAEAGFKNVYYMSDSFEGPSDREGKRTVSGWRINGLPYTYRLEPALVYKGSWDYLCK